MFFMFGVLGRPKIAENGQKKPKMDVHKWAFFEKTSSLILVKMAQMRLIGPLTML